MNNYPITAPIVMKKFNVDKNIGFHAEMLREIAALSHLNHENIVQMLGVELSENDNSVNIMLECGEWTLCTIVDRLGKITDSNVTSIMNDIMNAMSHIHSQGYVHGDMHNGNVVCFGQDCFKIIDFGNTTKFYRTNSLSYHDEMENVKSIDYFLNCVKNSGNVETNERKRRKISEHCQITQPAQHTQTTQKTSVIEIFPENFILKLIEVSIYFDFQQKISVENLFLTFAILEKYFDPTNPTISTVSPDQIDLTDSIGSKNDEFTELSDFSVQDIFTIWFFAIYANTTKIVSNVDFLVKDILVILSDIFFIFLDKNNFLKINSHISQKINWNYDIETIISDKLDDFSKKIKYSFTKKTTSVVKWVLAIFCVIGINKLFDFEKMKNSVNSAENLLLKGSKRKSLSKNEEASQSVKIEAKLFLDKFKKSYWARELCQICEQILK